jgi:hypothetical protein
MRVHYGNGGWVRVDEDDELPGPLYLRLAPDERGRWATRELYFEGEWRPLVAADLRELPLAAIEASVETSKLAQNHGVVAPNLSLLASFFQTTFGTQARHWVAESFRAQVAGKQPKRPKPAKRARPVRVPALRRPEGAITDDFLSHVSAAYLQALQDGLSPGKALAEQADVPLRTVHRWVYTARQRGIMPAGRRGRVT